MVQNIMSETEEIDRSSVQGQFPTLHVKKSVGRWDVVFGLLGFIAGCERALEC